MKTITIISLGCLLFSCNTPVDVQIEETKQAAAVLIAKEKTKQIEYVWKIDSLNSLKSDSLKSN